MDIAIAVAESSKADKNILNITSRDNRREVRLATLNNPKIGRDTLIDLQLDPDSEISEKANEKLRGMTI